MKPGSDEANGSSLAVSQHVAITSTLPVFEQDVPLHAPLQPRQMAVMTPQAREAFLYARNRRAARTDQAARATSRLIPTTSGWSGGSSPPAAC